MAVLTLTGMVFHGEPGGIWQGGGVHDWNCSGTHYLGGDTRWCFARLAGLASVISHFILRSLPVGGIPGILMRQGSRLL